MKRSPLRARILCVLFFCSFLVGPASAQASQLEKFVQAELSIQSQEQRISRLAGLLEEWLAGRLSVERLRQALSLVSKEMKAHSLKQLPASVAQTFQTQESQILSLISDFSGTAAPDAEGQRSLFSSLSGVNEKRTLALLSWRRDSLGSLLKQKKSGSAHNYYSWEAAWNPIWTEEAKLTRRLQMGLLQNSTQTEHKEILKGLLQLTLRADKLPCPTQLETIQKLSRERLTVLARTAEQLMRLEQKQTSGAISRVRRLSKSLTQLTEDFQTQRLAILKSLK